MKKAITILGVLFTLNSNAQYTTLFDFSGTGNNGALPYGSLYYDGLFLYGMTSAGGTVTACSTAGGGCGTIFKIMPDGTGYVDLHDFGSGTDGNVPFGSLISDGTYLYGMTSGGGTNTSCSGGCGTIFKIKPDGTGYVVLLNFTGAAIGGTPYGSLMYSGTFLYGMTSAGGTNSLGTAFKIKSDGTGYLKLHDFGSGTDGIMPWGDLYYDGNYLYGMTFNAGLNNEGNIFKIKPDGTGYVDLYDFAATGVSDGNSRGSLISDGTYLYGMTGAGGTGTSCFSAGGCGTIFKIKPDGTGFDTLLNFTGPNGGSPWGNLYYDGTYLYGITDEGGTGGANGGVIFKIKPDGTGFTLLYNIGSNINDGFIPYGSLVSDGTCFYGMTNEGGGSNNVGTVFKYCLAGFGIAQLSMNNENVKVYPNPSTDKTTISSTHNIDEVKVVDVLGQIVYEAKPHNKNITLQLENAGIYFVTITIGKEISITKIIVNK